MRGIAASVVVLYHYLNATGGGEPRFGYLAVDAFFMLSGFVLAFRYDQAFETGLGPREFLWTRAKRLYPIYGLGLALAAGATLLLRPEKITGLQVLGSFLFSLVCFPTPPLGATVPNYIFPLNAPFWSLFFEFWVANLTFALFWRRLHGRTLLAIVVLAAAAVVLNERIFYTFDVGARWASFAGGVARVAFTFYAGVGLARLHVHAPLRLQLGSPICLVVFAVIFFVPIQGRASHLFELVSVLLIFPALIFFGASAKERYPKIGAALGEASYAVYAIHAPILTLVLRLLYGAAPPVTSYQIPLEVKWPAALTFVLLVCALGWCVDRIYDKPIRAFLRMRGSKKR